MTDKTYFAAFIYYDTSHQRTNKFSHLSLALLEADKNNQGKLGTIYLSDCYGYYSHKTPESGHQNLFDQFLKKVFNVNFRLRHYYAEFKREERTSLDMGFGLKGGPLIEISHEEFKRLKGIFHVIKEVENTFFKDADQKTAVAVQNCQLPPKQKRVFAQDTHHLHREQYYSQALQNIEAECNPEDFIIEDTAYESGLISKTQLQQEKLRAKKGIEFFNFSFDPEGNTCKTMGRDLLIRNLDDGEHDRRKFQLSTLFANQYYTYCLPIASVGSSKIIFHTQSNNYVNNGGSPPLPVRNWEEHQDCVLAYYGNSDYIDMAGNHCAFELNIDKPRLYVRLLENLMFMQRLLNDFAHLHFEAALQLIDTGIRSMITHRDCHQKFIQSYYETLQNLSALRTLNAIREEILKTNQPFFKINYQKHAKATGIKLEACLIKEFNRLQEIEQHTKEDDLCHHLEGVKKWWQLFQPEPAQVTAEPAIETKLIQRDLSR